ncbi:hypothetical protein HR10_04580 [Porphyromonas gulae]|uniref:Uncharacterized protein n=1 Tax=Porphyromonas gulae TaxID=111105 RepID=A0A0A2F9A4_9PORP|nr:hypothetical protein HR15_05960 [Porphyromonas gulae]KKC51282.1 hypothetical protein HR10_04580 [Porphyromonas gulae]
MIPSSKDQIKEKILTDHNLESVRPKEKSLRKVEIRATLDECLGNALISTRMTSKCGKISLRMIDRMVIQVAPLSFWVNSPLQSDNSHFLI